MSGAALTFVTVTVCSGEVTPIGTSPKSKRVGVARKAASASAVPPVRRMKTAARRGTRGKRPRPDRPAGRDAWVILDIPLGDTRMFRVLWLMVME
jgi:hypothetical protein